MYSFLCDEKEEKRAKGISKVVVKKVLKHEHYRNTLFNETSAIASMICLRSHRHELFCETVQKTGLSAFDDKRYLLNSVESYAYSHYKINRNDDIYDMSMIQQMETSDRVIENPLVKRVTQDNSLVQLMEDQSFMVNDFKITPCN